MPADSNLGYRMSGTGTSAVFVDAAGVATESAALSSAPTGLATSA